MKQLITALSLLAIIGAGCGSTAPTTAATTTAAAGPTTTPPGEDDIDPLDAEGLCFDVFNAWEFADAHELLGLASAEASSAIQDHFGALGALRSSGTDCFLMEINPETDGELQAIGDLQLGNRSGSPIVLSVTWRSASDLDTDAALAARVDGAFLVVPFGGESDGLGDDGFGDDGFDDGDGAPLQGSDFTAAEIDQFIVDCVYYGDEIGACATLLQMGFDANSNYGLGNSYSQAPDEFLQQDCSNGDIIACAEYEVRSFPIGD